MKQTPHMWGFCYNYPIETNKARNNGTNQRRWDWIKYVKFLR